MVSGPAVSAPRDRGLWTVPNLISFLRLLAIPWFLWLLLHDDRPIAAGILLAVLGATDWVDGYIARRYDQGSKIGQILDPVADRVLLLAAAVALLIDGSAPRWVLILVLARELVISLGTLWLAAKGARRIDVQWVGKAGTLALMFALPMFLWLDNTKPGTGHDILAVVTWSFTIGGLVLSYYVAAGYIPIAREALRDGRAAGADWRNLDDRSAFVKAVILAGGEGTRLRPLTSNQPKPMMPIANRPMMEHIVRLLADHGFDEIVVTVAFLANQIRTYFGDGAELGVEMHYATEDTPLGTAGSVRNAADELDDTFLVIAGDVLTDVDLSELVAAHKSSGALGTIALKRVEDPVEFGIVITAEDGRIERFLEKPTWGQVFSDTINTGIYVLEPRIFDYIAPGEVVDFSGDVFPTALEKGELLRGHVIDGYWEDVGTLDAYLRAHQDILDGLVQVDIDGFTIRERVWLGEGADVDPDVRVDAPAIIGPNCRIEAGAHVGDHTVLGGDVVVKHDAQVVRSVVHEHTYLGTSTRIRGAVIGRGGDVRSHAAIEPGAVLGNDCFVGDGAVVTSDVKVYPFKSVEAGAVVTSSILWETRRARSVFGRRGASGIANVEITAELATRLAQAYGTSLKKGAVVTTSRDTSRVARALKRSVIGGLNLTGVNVEDVELATVPLTRFQVRNSQNAGGITVRLAAGDSERVEIRFFDSNGRDITELSQRKIERLLAREEFRRAFAGDIGDIVFPPRALEFYTAALEDSVDAERLRDRAFKVVLDYSFGAASLALPAVLAKVGADVLAVNPYAATRPSSLGLDERDARAARVGSLVRSSGSDLGMVIDPAGETCSLADGTGRVLDAHQSLGALLRLVTEVRPGVRVALPVSATRVAAGIVTDGGGEIRWTKTSGPSVMEAASRRDVDVGVGVGGSVVWPDFMPAFDATATLVKLLDLLAATGRDLASVVDGLPPVFTAERSVTVEWARKGAVMREMVEKAKGRDVVLVDGVKIDHDDGWALVLPDPDDAVVRVLAEGPDAEAAAELAEHYARRISED